MSAQRQNRSDPPGGEPAQDEEWVRVPAVVDANGDKVVTLYDERGRPQTRLLAELILEAFVGPRPSGHVARFKDGNRLNCQLTNLECKKHKDRRCALWPSGRHAWSGWRRTRVASGQWPVKFNNDPTLS